MGLTNYIEVELDNDHNYECEVKNIARKGENKATVLRLKLTDEMLDKFIYIDFEKPDGTKVKSERLAVDLTNKTADCPITNQLTDVVGIMLVEIVIEDTDNLVWKSYSKKYYITESIGAVVELSPENVDWLTQTRTKLELLMTQTVETLENAETVVSDIVTAKENGEFNGVGVPEGGTAGQMLVKVDDSNYNTEWKDATSVGGGGTNNYEDLINKPTINGSVLVGNKTTDDLGLESISNVELEELLII